MTTLFEKNIKLFARFCPDIAEEIEQIDPSPVERCQTDVGEENLRRQVEGEWLYLHDPSGANREATQWFKNLGERDADALFVYGIGLGYYYDAAKSWLQEKQDRFLLFFDDDFAAMHRFLETEKAHAILADPQVIILGIHPPKTHEWGDFRVRFDWIFRAFCHYHVSISRLKSYEVKDQENYALIANQIFMNLYRIKKQFYTPGPATPAQFYGNMYRNIAQISTSFFAHRMAKQFEGIPTLIVGAGPSLSKHYPRLKELTDKALIFGAGTGFNILTDQGIFPHFSAGVDATPEQHSRFATRTGFETPIFYVDHFSHEASQEAVGPHIFTPNTQSTLMTSWFEEQLGIATKEEMPPMLSTSNFCFNVAHLLGGSPLILVGMDLAYTDQARYVKGVKAHPTDSASIQKQLSERPGGALATVDWQGNPIQTKWEWVLEASIYTGFHEKHPNIPILNGTEGGMPIWKIPNKSLQEIGSTYMIHSYDILNWIHAAIQNSIELEVTPEKVKEVLCTWEASMEKCYQTSLELIKQLKEEGQVDPADVEKIHQEAAYTGFLYHTDFFTDHYCLPRLYAVLYRPETLSSQEISGRHIAIEIDRYKRLAETAHFHLRLLQRIHSEKKPSSTPLEASLAKPQHAGTYRFEKGHLVIKDPTLGIEIDEPFTRETVIDTKDKIWEGRYLRHYPTGELFHEAFYLNNVLHGPSTFWSKERKLLAKSWFYRGKRMGQTLQYDQEGNLISEQLFHNGKREGTHRYYTSKGVLRSQITYKNDQLSGISTFYYPSGIKKKEVSFKDGTLHGLEELWNEEGIHIKETCYEKGNPVGEAFRWYADGTLARKVVFRGSSEQFDLYEWDQQGNLVKEDLYLPEDSLETIRKQTEALQQTIKDVEQRLKNLNEH